VDHVTHFGTHRVFLYSEFGSLWLIVKDKTFLTLNLIELYSSCQMENFELDKKFSSSFWVPKYFSECKLEDKNPEVESSSLNMSWVRHLNFVTIFSREGE
jgi:hypothetical protein